MGDTKGGKFELTEEQAFTLLDSPNPNGRPGSDVIVPWINGLDLTRRPRDMFIIDFGPGAEKEPAAGYGATFERIFEFVRPARSVNKREAYRIFWWRHAEGREGMRLALAPLPRFIGTVTVSKHRLFSWFSAPTLPDHQLILFARSDDSFFGILHSRVHEAWARAQGTQLRERESGFRYTPTTCFETFPLPEQSTEPQREAIAQAACELDRLRSNWLNPPEWTREEVLEFPGSADGPWARYLHDPDERGIGAVRWPRTVAKDEDCAAKLKKRTLTNLYNERPTWLDLVHRRLDEAVLAAYGWPADIGDEQLLERLLALNLERAAAENDQTLP